MPIVTVADLERVERERATRPIPPPVPSPPPSDALPYSWCRHPEQCRGKGTCLRDPNCGE